MKPDKYGTPTQLWLFLHKWTSNGEAGRRCRDCKYYELDFEKSRKGSPRCHKGEFRTQPNATCDEWRKVEK